MDIRVYGVLGWRVPGVMLNVYERTSTVPGNASKKPF